MLTVPELRERLAVGITPIDGGLATELEARGADLSGTLWSGRVLLEDPATLRDVHRAYIDAGAEVIATASYQVSEVGFRAAGYAAGAADEALALSVEIARAAVGDSGVMVAASMGPYGAISHDGAEYRGRYGMSIASLARFHAERLDAVGHADLLAFETVPDLDEVRAITTVLEGRPAWISMSCRNGRSTCAGQRIEDAAAVAAECDSILAVGINCTSPRFVEELIHRVRSVIDLPIVVYPNSGREWNAAEERWMGDALEEGIAGEQIDAWVAAGASLIGGCCGTGPEDIARVTQVARSQRRVDHAS